MKRNYSCGGISVLNPALFLAICWIQEEVNFFQQVYFLFSLSLNCLHSVLIDISKTINIILTL